MKILLVNWMDLANPQAGGAEVQLMEIFKRLAGRGVEVSFICSRFPGSKQIDHFEGIKIYRTGSHMLFNYHVPRLLKKLDAEQNFDIIFEGLNKIPFFSPLFSKKPVIALIPHLFGKSIFLETNPLFASYVYLYEKPVPFIYKNSVFQVVSDSTSDDLQKRGVNKDKISVVHNGMDHKNYFVNKDISKFDQPTILYVGRLRKYKSVDIALRAMPGILGKMPDARLVIIGSGEDIPRLKKIRDELNLEASVIFTGFISESEKIDWLRRSHVLVNPSSKEGWGLTIIEANACGTTSVASNVDGLKDSVRDKETGLLFPYGDTDKLAGQLIELLTNTEFRKKMEMNAIEWSKKFTWESAVDQNIELFERILQKQSPL